MIDIPLPLCIDAAAPRLYCARSMTTELAHPAPRRAPVASRQRRGGFRVLAARLVLYWERLGPAILPVLGVAAIFTIFALLGFWEKTPAWLHWAALILGAGALGAFFWRDIRPLRWPSRRAAQARIEEDAKLVHAPLQSLDDRPSDANLQSNPLWRAHLKASADRARAARLNRPRDVLTARDPYGLRYLLTGLLAISFIAAGDQWRVRLAGMIDPTVASAGTAIADLWIEPPAYTGKAPIYLMRAGEDKSGLEAQVNAPEGARVVAQVNGGGRRKLTFLTEAGETRADFSRDKKSARGELSLEESGLLTLRLGGRVARWPVGVTPDAPPLIAWGADPEANENNLVDLSYISEDDYGIVAARLEMRLDPDQPRPLDFPAFDQNALDQARIVDLGAAGAGERIAVLDLQADPWAGLSVLARIIVEDGAGQIGVSEEKPLSLPTRRFFNPLARAVVEQRQTLAVSPEEWRRAGRSFDAVTMAPEVFFDRSTDYLLLRTAFWRVMRQDGEGFDDAVDEFWPLALQLEDEALELARQRLEAAQEALREAIERGASDEEIAQLTEELRQAMDDYLAALAQSGQPREQAGGGDSQQIERSNLDEMLDSIRDLAQSGAGAAARQMLSELENILNNLRLSQGGGGGGSGPGAPGEAGPSGEAGDLIGRQRELADEAFERDRNGESEAGGDLADEQGGIGRDLDDLIDELQGEGGELDPNGDAARSMGRARNEMREAEEALREGDFDAAADAMERAIAEMREGAEGLAREEMRQAGAGEDSEPRGGGTDPLGRPVGEAYGQGVDVPEETDAAKTRAIIESLRERLGEPGREEEEIDYLERLLERF